MRQSHKMAKHSQTIRWQIADELFECVWPFCKIGAERVNILPLASDKFIELLTWMVCILILLHSPDT